MPVGAALSAVAAPDLLGGVVAIEGWAISRTHDEEGRLVEAEQDFVAIPYHLWANRGPGDMIVWMRSQDARRPGDLPPAGERVSERLTEADGIVE